jgi:quinolinate synthase
MLVNKEEILKDSFVNAKIDKALDLVEEIKKMCLEKDAIILAHYYQNGEIQDIADFVGDSLALSQKAAKTDASIIVFAGVNFMAETAKILSPEKKVLLPDLNAGCSLAESCPAKEFERFIRKHKDHTVISYVNASAEIKALSDIVCTSTNAVKIVETLPENEKIIFAPDKNLGNYINSITGRNMVIWNGGCHVHEEFSLEKIMALKKNHPEAKIIAHPECDKQILIAADHVGSTSSLLKYTMDDTGEKYIVATESGILHQMKKENPQKQFIPAPPKDSSCGCNDCNFMKIITLEKIYNTIKYEIPEIDIDEKLRKKSEKPIIKMMEISDKYGF